MVLCAGLVCRFDSTSLVNRVSDDLSVLLAETATDSVTIDTAVERSRVVLGLGVIDYETGFYRLRKDNPSLVTDILQHLSNVERRRDPLGDPLDILESQSVTVCHDSSPSSFLKSNHGLFAV
jgi:hypothetical protein